MVEMSEHVAAAVQGALAGWTLGAQCRGRRGFRKLSFYDPIPPRMAPSHALEAWLVWSSHLKAGRSPVALCRSLSDSWHYPMDETVFGLGNVGRGLFAPASGAFNNPLSSGPEAIGRALYWGLVFHGRPDEAAEHAYYDASTDHDREGTWVAVSLARAVSLLYPEKGVTDIVRDINSALPKESKLRAAIPRVLKNVGEPDGARETWDALATALGIVDPFDAVLTASWTVLGLAHGGGRFEESVLATAGCGGAANHATMACGVICGFVNGAVPLAWTKHLGEALVCGHGLRGIEPPKTIDSFVKAVVADYEAHADIPEPVTPAPAEPGAPEPAPQPAPKPVSPEVTAHVSALLAARQDTALTDLGPLQVGVQYVDSPVVYPDVSLKLSLSFANTGDEEIRMAPQVSPPQGWEIAHKVGEFVLTPGASTRFAVVLKSKGGNAATEAMKVETPYGEATFPVFDSQLWYWVGPMANLEGTGFDKEYPAQNNIKLKQVFNGRSNMPVEWKPIHLPGERIDVESLFGTGPGVIYLYAEARMPAPGSYRIVAASGVGVIVWIDGQKKFWYHDTHTPVPRAVDPYLGSFWTDGTVKVLIKTFRNLEPVPTMSVYFLSEDGSLAVPVDFAPIA